MKYLTTIAANLLLSVSLFALSGIANSTEIPVCMYAMSDIDGDGYGWENRASCIVTEESEKSGSEQASGCIDEDDDGWGWNGVEICLVETDSCRDTAPVGDGWGWNGVTSCQITAYPAPFSEIETLRANTRKINGSSIAAATVICELNGRTDAIDFRSTGTAADHFSNYTWGEWVWSSWSTGLSDSDGIIWVYAAAGNSQYRTKIKLQPSVTIESGRHTGSCYWLK